MELRQLERFLAVVDHGTLAAGARELGLTQQALSASLSGLERELDVRLFDRGPGGITKLTPYGEALVTHARSQIAADRRARQALRSLAEAETGTVTVGIGETFAGDILAPAVSRLHAARPKLRINLIEGYSEQILERLYDGEFDFVAVGVGDFALGEGFRAEVLYSADDVVACRPGHPLAGKPRISLADLADYTWLVPYSRPSDVDVITETFVAAGLQPPTRFIGSDAYRIGMKLLAANDFLLMTSPALVTSRLAKETWGVHTLPIDRPTVRRNASLVTPTGRPMTPAAAALLGEVRAAASNYGDS
ncbi:MAG TPA: LysR family transcriptional regulator [Woeseiaceae bacterium]|nr:LysR family transcriptional regulator [Woeseiaceae bacterium]